MYKCVFGEWQACRGDKHDDPVTPMDVVDSKVENEVVVDMGVVQTLPAGADFIMCYSVAEGESCYACLASFSYSNHCKSIYFKGPFCDVYTSSPWLIVKFQSLYIQ